MRRRIEKKGREEEVEGGGGGGERGWRGKEEVLKEEASKIEGNTMTQHNYYPIPGGLQPVR